MDELGYNAWLLLVYNLIAEDIGADGTTVYSREYEYFGEHYDLIWHPITKLSYLCIEEREPNCHKINMSFSTMKHLTIQELSLDRICEAVR